ncbi:unnamed protein product [Cyclocybe aegerita]|uniref:F-box domain-containing protein n=1 Tax=Cyclocybe aegerita TaxID=1973307 RepID=A0A8S0XYV5_CYCAE|nr:unnamed protein product [Cyclocybe aegerita]
MTSILHSVTRYYAQQPVKYLSVRHFLFTLALTPEKARPRGLCALPLEVIIEIMKELEWRDLLRIRQTCKSLCDASKARPVWLNLFKPCPERPLFPLQAEGPLENYSSSRLEYMILRWKRAERSYAMNGEDVDVQGIEIALDEDQAVVAMHLVKGGRWLLLVLYNGSIQCCDLEGKNPSPKALIPHPFDSDNTTAGVHFSFDMVSTTPTLTFNIALGFRDGLSDDAINFLQVWQVSVILDEQGNGMDLRTCLLSSFVQKIGGSVHAIAISGPHLAYAFVPRGQTLPRFIFVVDWSSVNGKMTQFPQRIAPVEFIPDRLSFLPDHKLLSISFQKFSLLDWRSLEEASISLTSALAPVVFLWTHRMNYWRKSFFPHFCADSTRFVFESERFLHGLIIEHATAEGNPVKEPYIVELMEYPEEWLQTTAPRRLLGHNYGFGLAGHPGLTILRYSWPGEQHIEFPSISFPGTSVKRFDVRNWQGAPPCVDLGTGRVVFVGSFRGRLLVLDITC